MQKFEIMKNYIFLFLLVISSFHCFGQWRELNTGIGVNCYDIHCLDENVVLVCGGSGKIAKTINGGGEWVERFTMNGQINLLKIVFADTHTGYAGGGNFYTEEGVLLKTTDGGDSWEIKKYGDGLLPVGDIFVVDADTLYLLQRFSGELLKSTDGGENWQLVFTGDGNLLNFYFLEETGYLVQSEPGKIYKTTNYGQDWLLHNQIGLAHAFSIPYSSAEFCFKNREEGEVFGTTRAISEDGFQTCHSELLPWGFVYPLGPIYAKVKYLDNGRGCGIGFYHINSHFQYKVLITDDGHSWYNANRGINGMDLYAVDGTGDSTFYIAGGGGKVFKSTTMPTKVMDLDSNLMVRIYPNPAQDQITIESDQYQIQEISIADITGREVFRRSAINNSYITIDLHDWDAGMYFVTLVTGRGLFSQKIIKQ